MTPMFMLLVAWGILTGILIILLIYKSTLTMHEDDSIFLNETESQMQKDQMEVLAKMKKITPIVKVLGALSGSHDPGHCRIVHLSGTDQRHHAAVAVARKRARFAKVLANARLGENSQARAKCFSRCTACCQLVFHAMPSNPFPRHECEHECEPSHCHCRRRSGRALWPRRTGSGRPAKVLLFDEKLAWEKPCGGGITHKALQQYPFLAEAGESERSSQSQFIEHCELISPSGQRVRFHMQHPVAIFSRLALNGLLLERARRCRAVRCPAASAVTRINGRHEPTGSCTRPRLNIGRLPDTGGRRAQSVPLAILAPIAPSDLMVTAGYFIPGRSSLMQIQFLKGITGYIWVFPRADHVSAGIAGKMGEIPTAELRRMLEQWLRDNGFKLEGARFYSHILPSFRAQTFEALRRSAAMVGR